MYWKSYYFFYSKHYKGRHMVRRATTKERIERGHERDIGCNNDRLVTAFIIADLSQLAKIAELQSTHDARLGSVLVLFTRTVRKRRRTID